MSEQSKGPKSKGPKKDRAEEDKASNRREFMKRVAAVTAAAAAAGVGIDAARAQPEAVRVIAPIARRDLLRAAPQFSAERVNKLAGTNRVFAETLDAALKSGDINAAIQAKGMTLPEGVRKALGTLDLRDLVDLNGVLQKLDPRQLFGVSGVGIF